MAFVPVTNVVEVKFDHTYFGVGGKGWVFHYALVSQGAWDASLLQELLTLLVSWWDVSMQPLMSAQVTLNRIRARDLTTENGLQWETTTGLPLTGTRAGTPLQANAVLSLKKVTGFTGRSFRGRMYHFGLVTADIVNTNFISTATINALEAGYEEALLIPGAVEQYQMVLASKYSDGQQRPVGIATSVFDIQAVDSRIDTNRLKLPKGSA